MGFLRKILGRDDDTKGKGGTYAMPGPSSRRMRQVNPGSIDIALNPSRMDALPPGMRLSPSRDLHSFEQPTEMMKKGGNVKKTIKGGYRKAADGIATKGKTKGRMV